MDVVKNFRNSQEKTNKQVLFYPANIFLGDFRGLLELFSVAYLGMTTSI